jgi:hypothetical protein
LQPKKKIWLSRPAFSLPFAGMMRAKHREFLQVSGRRFHDPKNRMLRKLSHQVSEFYRLKKLYTKLKKKGWFQPRAARSLESSVYAGR